MYFKPDYAAFEVVVTNHPALTIGPGTTIDFSGAWAFLLADIAAKITLLDAAIWIPFGLESIVNPAPNNTRDAVWLLPGGLMLVAFWLIHQVQRSPKARFERYAYWVLWAALAIILFEPGSVAFGLDLSPIAPVQDHGAYTAGVEKGIALAIVGLGLIAVRNRIRRRTHDAVATRSKRYGMSTETAAI